MQNLGWLFSSLPAPADELRALPSRVLRLPGLPEAADHSSPEASPASARALSPRHPVGWELTLPPPFLRQIETQGQPPHLPVDPTAAVGPGSQTVEPQLLKLENPQRHLCKLLAAQMSKQGPRSRGRNGRPGPKVPWWMQAASRRLWGCRAGRGLGGRVWVRLGSLTQEGAAAVLGQRCEPVAEPQAAFSWRSGWETGR